MKDGISIVMAYHNRRQQLLKTLESINKTQYDKNKLQIVIVNDNSNNEHSIDDISDIFDELDLLILNIKEKQKSWINSCVPYNIGFSSIKYDKVIIQNPECYHQGDIIFDSSQRLEDKLYLSYGCYSLSMENSIKSNFDDIIPINEEMKIPMSDGWYNHSIYRPVYYHFCSAIKYEDLCNINGFDERYKDGIGFDDNEILERIKYYGMTLSIVDNPYVFHQAHHSVYHYSYGATDEEKQQKNNLFFRNQYIFENITKKEKIYKSPKNNYFNI